MNEHQRYRRARQAVIDAAEEAIETSLALGSCKPSGPAMIELAKAVFAYWDARIEEKHARLREWRVAREAVSDHEHA